MDTEYKIECLDCGYIGAPDIEDDGSEEGIARCPNCESMYLVVVGSITPTILGERFSGLLQQLRDIEQTACLELETDDPHKFEVLEDFRTDLSELVMKAEYICTQL